MKRVDGFVWGAIALLGLILIAPALRLATAGTTSIQVGTEDSRKAGHDETGKHEEGHAHGKEPIVRLSAEQMAQSGVRVETAGPGRLDTELQLTGQVTINADRLAHVVPRVSGVVRETRKTLGDGVKAGDVLAVIDSRELAKAKASYLAARERVALAQATFRREESLWNKKISAERDYLQARQMLAEKQIEQRAAQQKLVAMGLGREELQQLARNPEESLSRYEIVAPFTGVVIEKHISLGEAVEPNATIFAIADLGTVWVDLSVYPKDLPLIQIGQSTVIAVGGSEAQGMIGYVQPLVSEETRRTFARVVLDNRNGIWRPGLFVSGKVATGQIEVPLRIARSALQRFGGETVVFVQEGEGFEPRPVTLGRGDDSQVEIVAGLKPGERYVGAGSFILKAELEKGETEHEH